MYLVGDVIIHQEPYAACPSKFGSNCDGCFVSNNLKKCSACRIAWYCGSKCQVSKFLHLAKKSESVKFS